MRFIPDGSGPLLSLAAIVVTIAITATACQPAERPSRADPIQSESALIWNSPEGCKVYRLVDGYTGQYVHVTVCPNTASGSTNNVLATY